MSSCRVQ